MHVNTYLDQSIAKNLEPLYPVHTMHVQRDFVSISQGVVLEYQQRSRTNNERIIDHGRGLRRVRANANEVKRYCWNGARMSPICRSKQTAFERYTITRA